MSDRRLLLAGSSGPERLPARRDPLEPRWHEPLHVRDPEAARRRIADQVAAGADVVLAPTWRTHRRALLPVGETRRAKAWTAAAVAVAREGVELGLERRGSEPPGVPLVGAVLPALDEEPDKAEGRRPAREAATASDVHAQVGIMADSDPDLILVEDQAAPAATVLAAGSALQTGLPTWVAFGGRTSPGDATLERLAAACGECGVGTLLVPMAAAAGPSEALVVALSGDRRRWGGHLWAPPAATTAEALEHVAESWLAAGAGVIGVFDGAHPEVLGAVRRSLERLEQQEGARLAAARGRWRDLISRAARMAPGGRAAWIGSWVPNALPAGFEWTVATPDDAPRLPGGAYRLVVLHEDVPPGVVGREGLGRLLDKGGILACAADSRYGGDPRLRLVDLDETAEPRLMVFRAD